MKILVFSDSHGYCDKMYSIIKKFVSNTGKLDYIIHLGDLARDAKFLQGQFPEIPVLYVCGNSDFSFDRREQQKEAEIGGKKFFLVHGHNHNVYDPDSLKNIAEQKNYDIILHGHTHIPREDYHNNTYIICPGSIRQDRSGKGESFCVIDITENKKEMGVKIIRV